MRTLTQTDVDSIKAELEANKTQAEITKAWDISRSRLYKLQKNGWTLTENKRGKHAQKEAALALIAAGELTLVEIGKKLDVHPVSLGRWKTQAENEKAGAPKNAPAAAAAPAVAPENKPQPTMAPKPQPTTAPEAPLDHNLENKAESLRLAIIEMVPKKVVEAELTKLRDQEQALLPALNEI